MTGYISYGHVDDINHYWNAGLLSIICADISPSPYQQPRDDINTETFIITHSSSMNNLQSSWCLHKYQIFLGSWAEIIFLENICWRWSALPEMIHSIRFTHLILHLTIFIIFSVASQFLYDTMFVIASPVSEIQPVNIFWTHNGYLEEIVLHLKA